MIDYDEIVSIENVDDGECYDISLLIEDNLYLQEPNFIAQDIVVHNCKMHERYVERKRGREKWENEVPECVRDVLKKTYGVMAFQEQIMKILNVVGDIPLIHCEKIRKAISKKKTSEFEKYRQMFLENGSRKTGWPIESDDKKNMSFLWDLISAFSSYGFNASHAVAYAFISSRLLYLKAHYPIEFFCSTLALEGDEDKLKIFKREAERSGIKINRCDLNKSGVNYEIIDDEIYVGFSNIKGIGEDAAKQIVSMRPYSGVEDFLTRFGTDKRIIEPLICLGVFRDCEPSVAWEFYEEFKKWSKGNQDKYKRNFKRREDLINSMKSMLSSDHVDDILSHESIMQIPERGVGHISHLISPEFSSDDIYSLAKKYVKAVLDFEHKESFSRSNPISLENWRPSGKHPREWPSVFEIERKYYGFSWEHPIQKSGDYLGGHSFSVFKEDENILTAGVEVMVVKKPQEKVSKNGNKYYYVLVEDEDWNVEVVTFWSEDYARFKEELNYWNETQSRGNFLRIRLTRPGSGFKSYTFDSPPKKIRYKVIPADKEKDIRLQVMESPM